MKTKWTAMVFSVVGLVIAPAVSAQSSSSAGRAGSWETELGISFMNSSDADFEGGTSADFDSDIAWRFGVGYHYTDQLEFGGTLSFGQTDYDADVALDEDGDQEPEGFVRVSGDLDFLTLLGNATYNFMPGQFSPFVTGALGWSWVDTNIATEPPEVGCWWDPWWGYVCTSFQDTRTIDGFTYQLGVGARYDFSDTIAVKGAYRITWIDFDKADGTPDFDGFSLSVGWKF